VIRLSQAISDGFQVKKAPNRKVLALLDFSKAYNKVWWADLLATMLRKRVLVHYVRWIQGFASRVCLKGLPQHGLQPILGDA
jgi:hypothetical protein